MSQGYLDIPNTAIQEYILDIQQKVGVCEILPKGRFNIEEDGTIEYSGLVCGLTDGRQTGVGAKYCHNCELDKGENKCQ